MAEGRAPWRFTVEFTCYATISEASDIDDRVTDAIEAITGVPTEGGTAGRMDARDVIEGSPLHERIASMDAAERSEALNAGSGGVASDG